MEQYAAIIELVWQDRALLKKEAQYEDAVKHIVDLLDKGQIRVCEKKDGVWLVHEWVKKAVLLYFSIAKMELIDTPPFQYFDKIPVKNKNLDKLGIRVVPPAVARYGSYLAPQVILMPSYVNIGAYVDEGTMVDTWATIGSCAQIGKRVHISGGVGIGGVLEPVQNRPVIIEDGCFIGSRCILVEGVVVEQESVVGAGVVVTGSTKIIDVSTKERKEYQGYIPARSVVIPGTIPKEFPAGVYQVPCAFIIGKRKHSTDMKTSLNDALRDFNIAG
ncbi:MAG: 2,3,4,5-tetrahydropyridine-2,6-dicarboxylate N-succinyltransferase [Phycisphaerales bacterium]|nr:2,3,4,5-tetrahydropyridine-2,6-dicarboxylate N-succinyltransferase [Phycisphaerales bacterium]